MANSIRSSQLQAAGHKCSIISVTYKYTFLVQLRLLAMTWPALASPLEAESEPGIGCGFGHGDMGIWGIDIGIFRTAVNSQRAQFKLVTCFQHRHVRRNEMWNTDIHTLSIYPVSAASQTRQHFSA